MFAQKVAQSSKSKTTFKKAEVSGKNKQSQEQAEKFDPKAAMDDFYQNTTNKILAELSKGTLPWVKPWNGKMGLPRNGSTDSLYAGSNAFNLIEAIFENNWDNSRFLTIKQINHLKGKIKKGSVSTRIVKPITIQIESKDQFEEDGSPKVFDFLTMKLYSVFNVEQVEGLPETYYQVPAITGKVDKSATIEGVQSFLEKFDDVITIGGNKAYYSLKTDKVTIPNLDRFENMHQIYAVTFHELAHWTGSDKRLNREMCGQFGSENYAVEELVAELTGALLCAYFGVDGYTQHSSYIKSWMDCIQADNKIFHKCASQAQKSFDFLLSVAGISQKVNPNDE